MTSDVLTPITQALNEGALTRRELKAFMRRSDWPAIRHLALWLLVLGVTGFGVHLALGGPWLGAAMTLHGVVVVHHFALQHESAHYTVFATRRLNDIAGQICGFVILVPHQFFRYEHCDHHTYTQLMGKDPELIELPTSAGKYLWYLSALPYWWGLVTALGRHGLGRLSEADRLFLPKEAHSTIILEARLYLAGYAAIALASIATGWAGALWYWVLPSLLGQPVMRAIRMTEHVGRPNTSDFKVNTRTNLVSAPMRFLCWNMNYHAEHHYAASVPFHALPALHRKLDGYIHVEPRGYIGAHADILSQIFGRVPRADRPDAG
ncbi:MAG: fatty acid desaturase family protein [Albidovulum sp.]|uniref:fatty acid desaturase family protein n=1 Tax=Albidovulum sp. TaxID=1872424 RepID=UPI003CB94037